MLLYDGYSVTRVKNRRAQNHEQVFLPLLNPKPEDVRRVVGEVFDCHPLVVEDCLQENARPRLNIYDDHAFFPFYFLRDDWQLVEVAVVMGHNFVIAILREPSPFLAELEDTFERSPEKMKQPGRILYEFLDTCIHHYLDFVDSVEDTVDEMENQIYESPMNTLAPTIFSLKRQLHKTRRVFSEERTVIESLMHVTFPYTQPDDNTYFADLFDHITRIVDGIDNFRDALTGLMDLQMSLKSDRMNSIMKTLTVVSTFFMPLSFIVGLYGMNVKVPEYGWTYGYLWVWGWMIASVVGLWIYFKRRGWF